MAYYSPHRHLVPKGMRPRQRAELKAEFPTHHSRGLAEALREAIEQIQAAERAEVEDPALPHAPGKRN